MTAKIISFTERIKSKRDQQAKKDWEELYSWWSINSNDLAEFLQENPDHELEKGLTEIKNRKNNEGQFC